MSKVKRLVSELAKDMVKTAKEGVEKADQLSELSKDPDKGTQYRMQMEALSAKLNALKQLNNSFKYVLDHDKAKAKFKGFKSSFEEE